MSRGRCRSNIKKYKTGKALRQIQDSQGQSVASAFIPKSLNPIKLLPLRRRRLARAAHLTCKHL